MPINFNETISFICPKCHKIFHTQIHKKLNHIRWCQIDDKGNKIPSFHKVKFQDINWNKIQAEYDTTHSWIHVIKLFNLSRTIIKYGQKNKLLSLNKRPFHTKETKNKLSKIRQNWIKLNPDKHYWRNNKKFVSKPCEYVKNILNNKNISFVEEFEPIKDRGFSIDIAFPNDKIGIEINGNQHYNRDGSLKEYYNNRHIIIEKEGWKLYEIPYMLVYNETFIDLLKDIMNKIDTHIVYKPNVKKKNNNRYDVCPICGNKKQIKSKMCIVCRKEKRKENIPTKKELLYDIRNFTFLQLSKKYGVSNVAIRKWCKSLGIYEERKIKHKK